jgi:hypothetical protein
VKVEVAVPVTLSLAKVVVPAERNPAKVDVEFVPFTLTKPAKVEVAVVEVAVINPTVGDPVALTCVESVQNVSVFGEPPESEAAPPETQTLLTAKQPAERLIPPVDQNEEVAAVKLATLFMAKIDPGVLVLIPTPIF